MAILAALLLAWAGDARQAKAAPPCGPYVVLCAEALEVAGIPEQLPDFGRVLECETGGRFDPRMIGDLSAEAPGISRGLWQINTYWHPEVTNAQAFDPEWSTHWAAAQWAADRQHEWSCWRIVQETRETAALLDRLHPNRTALMVRLWPYLRPGLLPTRQWSWMWDVLARTEWPRAAQQAPLWTMPALGTEIDRWCYRTRRC